MKRQSITAAAAAEFPAATALSATGTRVQVHNDNSAGVFVLVTVQNEDAGREYYVPRFSRRQIGLATNRRATALAARTDAGAPLTIQVEVDTPEVPVDEQEMRSVSGGGDLLAANNLSDVANAATARGHLGLGSAAVLASAAVCQTANNLSDVADAETARDNLGLGSAATKAIAEVGPSVGCVTTAYLNANQVVANGDTDVVEFANEDVDLGNDWSITEHEFTAPAAGNYLIICHLRWTGASARCVPIIYSSAAGALAQGTAHVTDGPGGSSVSYIGSLNEGDTIEVRANNVGSGAATLVGAVGATRQNFISITRLS